MRRKLDEAIAANHEDGFAEVLDGIRPIAEAWRQLCLLYTSFAMCLTSIASSPCAGSGIDIPKLVDDLAAASREPKAVSYTHLDVYKRQAITRS